MVWAVNDVGSMLRMSPAKDVRIKALFSTRAFMLATTPLMLGEEGSEPGAMSKSITTLPVKNISMTISAEHLRLMILN